MRKRWHISGQPLNRCAIERRCGRWLICVLLISDNRREPLISTICVKCSRSASACQRGCCGDGANDSPHSRGALFVIEGL